MVITSFQATTSLEKKMAYGHLIRKGHALTGYYELENGFSTLVRTCCK